MKNQKFDLKEIRDHCKNRDACDMCVYYKKRSCVWDFVSGNSFSCPADWEFDDDLKTAKIQEEKRYFVECPKCKIRFKDISPTRTSQFCRRCDIVFNIEK